jgi:hypothetical protein
VESLRKEALTLKVEVFFRIARISMTDKTIRTCSDYIGTILSLMDTRKIGKFPNPIILLKNPRLAKEKETITHFSH